MDILSYSSAKKAHKRKLSIVKVLGASVEGSFSTVKKRVDKLESNLRDRSIISDRILLNAELGLLALKRKQELAGIALTDAYDHIMNLTFEDSSAINAAKTNNVSVDSEEKEILIKKGGKLVLKPLLMKSGVTEYYIEAVFKELVADAAIRIDVTYYQSSALKKKQLIRNNSVIRIGDHLSVNQIEVSIQNLEEDTIRMSALALIWK